MASFEVPGWRIDPGDPRAPSQEVWDGLTPDQRQQVLDSLPSEVEPTEASPPEGDYHAEPVSHAREVLRGFFRRQRRRVYVGADLPVYYPGERMFAPDVMAVLDVDDHPRDHWTVSTEGKGLDLAIEVHWRGRARKDLEERVVRYASLGIREYFVFDLRRLLLHGHRLPAAEARSYERVLPQAGRFDSEVLGLGIAIEGIRLRFYVDNAPLPFADELVERLQDAMDGALQRAEAEAQRADAEASRAQAEASRAQMEASRAQTEASRAQQAEQRLAEALAEIERLRRRE